MEYRILHATDDKEVLSDCATDGFINSDRWYVTKDNQVLTRRGYKTREKAEMSLAIIKHNPNLLDSFNEVIERSEFQQEDEPLRAKILEEIMHYINVRPERYGNTLNHVLDFIRNVKSSYGIR